MTGRDDCSSWAAAFDGMPIPRHQALLVEQTMYTSSRSLGMCIFEGIMKAPMYVGGLPVKEGRSERRASSSGLSRGACRYCLYNL